MSAIRRPLSPEAALARMQSLCARAEYCTHDIRQKLYRLGLPTAQISKIVSSLVKDRFIDDQRYATAFVREKFGISGWGRIKIRYALQTKQISPETIAESLEEIDPEAYMATLQRTLQAKRATLDDPESYETRAKLMRFAASRGFEPSLIAKALDAPSR